MKATKIAILFMLTCPLARAATSAKIPSAMVGSFEKQSSISYVTTELDCRAAAGSFQPIDEPGSDGECVVKNETTVESIRIDKSGIVHIQAIQNRSSFLEFDGDVVEISDNSLTAHHVILNSKGEIQNVAKDDCRIKIQFEKDGTVTSIPNDKCSGTFEITGAKKQ